jgi:hypothetical protein
MSLPSILGGETFDLHVRAYCQPGASSPCGYDSEELYRKKVLNIVHEANLRWAVTGISFRPVIFPIEFDDFYSEVQGCDTAQDAFGDFAANVAASAPEAVTILVTEHRPGVEGYCCATIGGLGITCNAGRKSKLDVQDEYELGGAWAHELGHHFCLPHTFTFEDPAETAPAAPDHDGDNLADTPDDPGLPEGTPLTASISGASDFVADDLVKTLDGHEFCTATKFPDADAGSNLHTTFCTGECKRCFDGPCPNLTGLTTTSFQPDPQLVMSYYHISGCGGPVVYEGDLHPAFSPDSEDRILSCRASNHASLVDVCAGPGDDDHDGICDDSDNCPEPNTSQADSDGDGVPDGCDPCPQDSAVTSANDTDGDGLGDPCDPDIDGDGCLNSLDQHPFDSRQRIGTLLGGPCLDPAQPIFGFEGNDSDDDGVRDCSDRDDDNDGLCDEGACSGICPGKPAGGCVEGPGGKDPCPVTPGVLCVEEAQLLDCPEWTRVCFPGQCLDFFLKLVEVVNPDPTRERIFDRFEIVNQTLYVFPLAGLTPSQTAKAFEGLAAARAGASRLRLEIWSRRRNRKVAEVAEYDPAMVRLGAIRHGTVVALTPVADGRGDIVLDIDVRHAVGVEPGDSEADSDGDGRPDSFDDCLLVANFLQTDADLDGFGDACDADLDQDLLTAGADVGAVRACEGADLDFPSPAFEPAPGRARDFDFDAYDRRLGCQAADLDGDRLVTAADTGIAEALLGRPPGPSARRKLGRVQSPDQQNCILALNEGSLAAAAAQLKRVTACVKRCGQGDAAACPEPTACWTSDPTGRVSKKLEKIESSFDRRCGPSGGEAPDFGLPAGSSSAPVAIRTAVVEETLGVARDVFGDDRSLNTAFIGCAADRAGCKCQQAVSKAIEKSAVVKLTAFVDCKRAALEAGASAGADLEACLLGSPESVEDDPRGKIAKRREKLAKVLDRKCAAAGRQPVDTDGAFPGQCAGIDATGERFASNSLAQCLDRTVGCRVCRLLNAVDGLSLDCDLFDDAVANSTCVD